MEVGGEQEKKKKRQVADRTWVLFEKLSPELKALIESFLPLIRVSLDYAKEYQPPEGICVNPVFILLGESTRLRDVLDWVGLPCFWGLSMAIVSPLSQPEQNALEECLAGGLRQLTFAPKTDEDLSSLLPCFDKNYRVEKFSCTLTYPSKCLGSVMASLLRSARLSVTSVRLQAVSFSCGEFRLMISQVAQCDRLRDLTIEGDGSSYPWDLWDEGSAEEFHYSCVFPMEEADALGELGSHIEVLNLAGLAMRWQGMNALAEGMPDRLVHLDLSRNFLRPRGATILAQALPGSSVETVLLEDNFLQNEGAWAIISCLRHTVVRCVKLSRNGITSLSGFGLEVNESLLEVLDLSLNILDDRNSECATTLEEFFECMARNTRLRSLSLCWNFLQMSTMMVAASMLRQNHHLAELNVVSECGLKLEDVLELCKSENRKSSNRRIHFGMVNYLGFSDLEKNRLRETAAEYGFQVQSGSLIQNEQAFYK